MSMTTKHIALSAGLLIGATSFAAAAPAIVSTDLNMRSGPGTNYRVVDVLPGGATVDVRGCSGSWCRVRWGGDVGYASRNYLSRGTATYGPPVYAAEPPIVVGPSVGIGFSWDSDRRWRHGRPHHHRHHNRDHNRHHDNRDGHHDRDRYRQ